MMWRFVVAGAVVAMLTIATPPPAAAHSAGNTPSSNYVSRVLRVSPTTAGFTASVVEAGNRFEVKWVNGPEVLIEDYDGHPYLRVGPQGSFENRQSNAVYLNADRQGATLVPEGLRPDGPPEWRNVSSSPVVRFHDHRVHWMGASPPAQVQRARGDVHLIQTWVVPVTQGASTFIVSGDLRWVPGPSPVVPLVAVGVLAGALVCITAMTAARGSRRRAVGLFCGLLILLVLADALHLVGIAFGVNGGSGVGRVVSIGWVSVCAWVIALVSIVALVRRRMDAIYVGVFAAGVITLVGGLSDLSVLSSSSVPFAFSNAVARGSIALTLGLGIATVLSGVLLTGVIGSPGNAGRTTDIDHVCDEIIAPAQP